jgi:hypothetical protein
MKFDDSLNLFMALYRAAKDEQQPHVELKFADGRKATLCPDLSRTLLDQDIVFLGFEELPELVYLRNGKLESIKGCTNDARIIAVARRFLRHLDGRIELKDGEVIY